MSDAPAQGPAPALVDEAVGPDLPAGQATAIMAIGVISLLVAGVLPALLGALVDEYRLTAAGLGQCATLEGLFMGIATAIAAAALKANHLRPIAIVSSLALAVVNLLSMHTHGNGLLVMRALAGIPEGVMLWITIGMIARSELPERWAGVFLTALVAAQLVLAMAYAFFVLPRFGADGGFAALALCALGGIAVAPFLPRRYEALVQMGEAVGLPSLRGIIALLATLLYMAAVGAVGIYLQPLAHEAGLDADVARTALWVSLAAQIGGGLAATMLAGRMHYFTAFVVATIAFLTAWILFAFNIPALVFIAANALSGFTLLFVTPFLVPMTIEADPTRRAAMQSGAVQVLAGALGPLMASFVVGPRDVHGALMLGAGLVLGGLGVIAGLHVYALRSHQH